MSSRTALARRGLAACVLAIALLPGPLSSGRRLGFEIDAAEAARATREWAFAGSPPSVRMQEPARTAGARTDGLLHVAVLREDGIMLPFASFDGRNWKSAWPQSVDRVLPASLDDIPDSWWGGSPPGPWHVWRPGEKGRPAPLSLKSPATIAVGQVRRLGIRTDYPLVALPVHPFAVPFPKAGLAVAGTADLKPIASVSRLSPAWGQMLGSVRRAVDLAEERAVVALQRYASWAHPYKRSFRERVEPELEAWYTTRFADVRYGVSYVEAVKKYPPGPKDQGCGLESFITGWVHHEPKDAPPKTELRAAIMYCDRDRASYMQPFGELEARGRTHWIVQMAGQDHEWYAVVELRPGRVRYVAQYEGGRVYQWGP
jgi:hypothetical protein